MHIGNAIIGLGKPIAYFPGLRPLTGSINATVLLCQLLYWTGAKKRDSDGWIYKTSDELEEETGLTYYELKTAKEKLVESNLIKAEFKRLSHSSRYIVLMSELQEQWEELTGEDSTEGIEEWFAKNKKSKEPAKTASDVLKSRNPNQDGDIIDVVLDVSNKNVRRDYRKREISDLIEKMLHILPRGKYWEEFVTFVYNKEVQSDNKETAKEYLTWCQKEGFDPKYWTPQKMITMWPQAFVKQAPITKEEFIKEHREPEPEDDEEFVSVLTVIGKNRQEN